MQNISRAVNIVQTREWYIPYIKYYKVLKQKQADPSVYQLQPQISSSEFELYRNTLIETECTYAQPICFKDIQRFMFPWNILQVCCHSPQMLMILPFGKLGKACILNVEHGLYQTILQYLISLLTFSMSLWIRISLDVVSEKGKSA